MLLRSLLGYILSCWSTTCITAYSSQLPLKSLLTQHGTDIKAKVDWSDSCPQVAPHTPSKHSQLDATLNRLHDQDTFQSRVFETLGGAIRIPTESYDDLLPVGQDPRWDVFALLHSYLEETFPRIYGFLDVTKVNTYGLVYHWQGSANDSLPILITAHQDVVPVEPATIDKWVQPPYSGHYDGTWIWGRGAVDDKSDLISILITIDSLLTMDFKPTRTFVVAFGFDEEASSIQGAGHLYSYLEDKYGVQGFASLLDEGGGFGALFGGDTIFATPATTEKGYFDLQVEVSTLGGHSSVPPVHTGIGILASAIVAIEANPRPLLLTRNGTAFEMIQCAAAYGPGTPDTIKSLVKKAEIDDNALAQLPRALVQLDPRYAAIMTTTQAVDLVHGGVKINALPEKVDAVVNHRIAEHSSVSELQTHLTEVLLPIASTFDLTFNAFGTDVVAGIGKGGHLALSDAWGTALEPAPTTPTGKSGPYELLSGTIKAALARSPTYQNHTAIVMPSLALGNTDTRWYWNLTKHIFRYSHNAEEGIYGEIHTINEALRGDAFIDKIRFHTKFILNWDESLI